MIDFYDVDKKYIEFLQNSETEVRGFTRVPNMEYGVRMQKFLCGIVLKINEINYYVPVTSKKERLPDSVLVLIPTDKIDQIKGSLKFNYMIPVPDFAITVRKINSEPDLSRRRFLNGQLLYCQSIETIILNQARRTYNKWFEGKGSERFYYNCCDFKLLEEKYKEFIETNK